MQGTDKSGYCKWCWKCEELVNCGSCTMQFCKSCIARNLGEECLSDATTVTTWRCCCCSPSLLENSISQYEKVLGSTSEPSISESGSDHSEAENGVVNRYAGYLSSGCSFRPFVIVFMSGFLKMEVPLILHNWPYILFQITDDIIQDYLELARDY